MSIRDLTARSCAIIALSLAIAGGCSSGGSSGKTPPKVANVTFPIDVSLVDYTQAHGDAAFKAKAKDACEQQKVDSVELTVEPTIGGPSATFSYTCKDL